jgi:hypothetical protein
MPAATTSTALPTIRVRDRRDECHGGGQADDAEDDDGAERAPPPQRLADQRSQRHPQRRRYRHSTEDYRHRAAGVLRRDDGHRDGERHADEQAMKRAGQGARGDERPEIGRQHGEQGSREISGQRRGQQQPPGDPDRQRGEDRPTDCQSQCIRGDQRTGGADGHPGVVGDEVQHADDAEFSGAEHERAQEQGCQR